MPAINKSEKGAVSIFIVIFTALLVTVVTTSFVQIMLRNQQQASDNDLSQSAYDSAMAGVEDAKRALIKLRQCSLSGGGFGCDQIQRLVTDGDDCEVLDDTKAGISDFVDGEVKIGNDQQLNQAYTCVTINPITDSFDGEFLRDQETVVIPLEPVSGAENIAAVRVSWYTQQDLPDGEDEDGTPADVDGLPTIPARTNLVPATDWGDDVPPMMRAQLIQFEKGNIVLDSFNGGNARSLLLYPQRGTNRPFASSFALDSRRQGVNQPQPGGCRQNFDYEGFACSFEIALPPQPNREAYLQLAAIYNRFTTRYKVEMIGAGDMRFNNVQPQVDSTGRASDLFRRVRASVTVSDGGTNLPFPEAAVITENLCKEFFVTNDPANYQGNGNGDGLTCTP